MTAAYQCPVNEWCEESNPLHVDADAHGFGFSVSAHESVVNVLVHHYDQHEGDDLEDQWAINLDFGEWVIEPAKTAEFITEALRELDDIRSIVDQVETRLRAFHQQHICKTEETI